MKIWNAVFYAFALFPLSFSISLLSFYFHAASVLGKFPSYGQPDPKELGFYGIYASAIHLSGNVWLFSFIPWLLFTVIYLVVKRKQISWKPLIISAVCQIGAVALFLSGVMEWFAD
jgi:hypothetical protein